MLLIEIESSGVTSNERSCIGVSSFPDSPHALSVLQATESWAGPGNEASIEVCELFLASFLDPTHISVDFGHV